jgi:hypothetical protein
LLSWLKLGAQRISPAFAFKGPARFHPMTLADLGKDGDQIDRLFSEPADILLLQHCLKSLCQYAVRCEHMPSGREI